MEGGGGRGDDGRGGVYGAVVGEVMRGVKGNLGRIAYFMYCICIFVTCVLHTPDPGQGLRLSEFLPLGFNMGAIFGES